jgi:hypothetical protein
MDFQKPANGSEKRPREKSLIAFVGRREHDAFALAPCTRRLRSGAHQTATAAHKSGAGANARIGMPQIAMLTTLETGVRRLSDTAESLPAEIAACAYEGESRLVETADGQAFLHVLNAGDGVALVNIPKGAVGNLPT